MATVLRGADVIEIQHLKRQGLSISEIAAQTGFNRRTIRKYLTAPQVSTYGPRAPRPSVVEPFRSYLEPRLAQGAWNAVVLFQEIQARGYTGSYSALKRFLRPLRTEAKAHAVRRFETPPGQQAQVDWGHLGSLTTKDAKHSLSAFTFTLGHSRALFADLALDQRLPTFLRLHEAAFAALGGIPKEILYDWAKTVVLGVDERGEPKWHPIFLDFAGYWGFVPRLCRTYRPQTKGKVENGIGYLRKNFLCGRQASGFVDLRGQLATWNADVAMQRVHGTTHQRVQDAWHAERPFLQPITGQGSFPLCQTLPRTVARDAYVAYRTNRYSVPWRVAGHEVSLREVDGSLEITRQGERLAVHPLCRERHRVITVLAHHQD